jgi:hypothetical protein
VLGEVVPAFDRLREQGKTLFLGLTAVGDTAALHQVIDAGVFDSAQVVYNMLNPSAAAALPALVTATSGGLRFGKCGRHAVLSMVAIFFLSLAGVIPYLKTSKR